MTGALLVATSAWAGPDRTRAEVAVALLPTATVSSTLSYQGQLLSGGNPVNGTPVITFSVYAQSSGGMPLWSQAMNVTVNKGLFTAQLQVDPRLYD